MRKVTNVTNVTKLKRPVLLSLALAALAAPGCTLTKSENPLSPTGTGSIAGVNITAPNPVTPRDGFRIFSDQQPITLTLNNATSSGAKPILYLFELSGDAAFAGMIYTIGKIAPGAAGKTELKVPTTLTGRKTYYWRAKAQDGTNDGPFSPSASFEIVNPIAFQAPVPTAPANGATATTLRPNFTWTNAPRTGTPNGTVVYEVQVAENSAFTNAFGTTVNETAGVSTSGVPPQDGKLSTTYYWRVRAKDDVVTGPYSATHSFTTPAPAPVVGGGGTGGPANTACHAAPGPLTMQRASDVIYGCGTEFPHLIAVFPTEEQAVAAADRLLQRIIWHLKLAGYDAARQRNPSGLISRDKMSLFIDGAWHVYDIFTLGFSGVATRITGLNEVPLPNPVPHPGIPD
jgi:hypothetical protein